VGGGGGAGAGCFIINLFFGVGGGGGGGEGEKRGKTNAKRSPSKTLPPSTRKICVFFMQKETAKI
jgi:hypothetical protein